MPLETPFLETNPASHTALLADPAPSLLADYLAARMASENGGTPALAAPGKTTYGTMPSLPRVQNGALKLYLEHKAVDSYPLLYTTLALAHPN